MQFTKTDIRNHVLEKLDEYLADNIMPHHSTRCKKKSSCSAAYCWATKPSRVARLWNL